MMKFFLVWSLFIGVIASINHSLEGAQGDLEIDVRQVFVNNVQEEASS